MNQKGNLKYIFYQYLRKNKIKITFYIILLVLSFPIEQIILPHVYGIIIDVISKSSTKDIIEKSYKYIGIIVGLLILSQTMFCAADYLDVYLIPELQTHYRKNLVNDIIKRFQENYKELEVGELISKIVKLPFTIRDIQHQAKNYVIPSFLICIYIVFYFLYINKNLGLLTCGIIVVFLSCIYYFVKKCMISSQLRDQYHNTLHEEISDTFNNILSIYTSDKTESEINRINNYQEKFDNKYRNGSMCALQFKVIYSIMYIAIFAIIYMYAIYLTYKKKISVGNLASVLFVTTYLINYLQNFAAEIRDLLFNMGTLKESQVFIDQLINSKNLPNNKNKLQINYGDIKFVNISFKFEFSKTLLFNKFNLHIKPNQNVAIIGKNGSGKSTLTKLIMKLYNPQSGHILLDNQKISFINANNIRKQIGYVHQNPKLFNRTIYENITYENGKPCKANIIKLMKQLKVYHIFQKYDNILGTMAGKNGNNLSGGQRQIIAILRIMLSNKKILILDEPTSALDEDSKVIVVDLIKKLMENKTTIMITHDKSLLRYVDRIIQLQDGKIIEDKLIQ